MRIQHGQISSNSGKQRQTLCTLSATIGSFSLGTVLGWTSPSLPNLQESEDLGYLSQSEITWIASLAILGALISGPLTSLLLNKIGRRGSMLVIAPPFTLGWLMLTFSSYLPVLIYYARFLTGLCGGAFTVIIPVYVSEIAEERFRGCLGSLMVLMLVSGILFSYFIGAFLSWFWVSAVCAGCPIMLFIAMTFMPESPKFLILQNKLEMAEKSFRWLRGLSETDLIGDDFIRMKYGIDIAEVNSDWRNIFSARVFKPALICTSLMFFQQLGGINSVTMYTVDIFKSASDDVDPNLASIIIGIVQVFFVYVSMTLVDRVGRKVLLACSSILMSLSMSILGSYFYFKEQNDADGLGFIPIVSLMTFIIAYSFGMGPIPWLLVSELCNPEFSSEISAVITFTYWSLAFAATKTFQDMINLFGESGCYWSFGGICCASAIFTIIFVPETKGKTSIEIQNYFNPSGDHNRNVHLSFDTDRQNLSNNSSSETQTEKLYSI